MTLPVDPGKPRISSEFKLKRIFGINARSAHTSLAWEFLRYIHGDEYMRLKSKSSSELLTRSAYKSDYRGRDFSDFYKLKPDVVAVIPMVSAGFTRTFRQIAQEEMTAAANGSRSADEAYARLFARGEEALGKGLLAPDREEFGIEEAP